jgi:transposase, IS5 family
VIRQAERVVRRCKRTRSANPQTLNSVRKIVHKMERVIKLGRQVVAQTKARIYGGNTQTDGKILSIFEPETQILRRGKSHNASGAICVRKLP